MNLFYLSGFGLGTFAIAINLSFSVIYFFTMKKISRSTFYFNVFIISIFIVFSSFSFIYSSLAIENSRIAWWILHSFVYGSIAIVMFVYNFRENINQKESKIIFFIFLILSTISLLIYIYQTYHVKPIFVHQVGLIYYDIAAPGIVIGIEFGWFFFVMIRKILKYSDYKYEGRFAKYRDGKSGIILKGLAGVVEGFFKVFKTKEKYSRALRNFILIFLNMLYALIVVLLAILGFISWLYFTYFTSVLIFIAFYFLYAFYIDNAPEPFSFMIKLLSGSVTISLLMLGISGVFMINDREAAYHSQKIDELKNVQQFLENQNEWNPPDDLVYVAEVQKNEQPVLVFSDADKKNILLKYLKESERPEIVFSKLEPGFYSFNQGSDLNPETFFYNYFFKYDDRIYEVGYSYEKYRLKIHEAAKLIWIIFIVATVIIVILLPLFFKTNMTGPMSNILNGIRQVNAGDLSVAIPIRIKDEMGIISESFNGMVSSIRDSRRKLQDYALNLEGMVEQRTSELKLAKEETDHIMKNVDEGLFLVFQNQENYEIGNEYSKALEYILQRENLSRANFLEVIAEINHNESVVENAKKYLNLMFRPAVEEGNLFDLNPLMDAEFKIAGRKKYLNFKFRRVIRDDQIQHLLVTVVDVTEQIMLSMKLQETEQKNKTKMEMLFKVLHVDPAMLDDFMIGANEEMAQIDKILKSESFGSELEKKIDPIYRSIHSVKGNAALLGLDFIVDIAHHFEDTVADLRLKNYLKGEDFLPLAILYHDLQLMMEEMNGLVQKLVNFQNTFGEGSGRFTVAVLSAVNKTIEKLSEDFGKSVHLNSESFSLENVPAKMRILIKDILIQLIRNSMVHGIESPEERIKSGKTEKAEIRLTGEIQNGRYQFTLYDDGKSFNLNALKEKAVQHGIAAYAEISGWDNKRIAELIFNSGMSTSEKVTTHAGRGVGMDLIKEKVENSGGKIDFDFQEGKFSEFKISLPLPV
ncbi:MAG: ATP-binding protein [Spirochaetia bacterium]|nr:ATP-binding protein [Spirochaetia bacterium]